nr:MerR family transcriptional regulator [Ornithinimicrobium sp. F0845]
MPIGELSRASGLTVSALRFYDRQGVLTPAAVDPATGYRRYSPAHVHDARLIAGMRRIGLPLAEMTAVQESLPDTAAAEDLLTAHLRRLEDGLSDARREVARLTGLLAGPRHAPVEIRVGAAALARALDGVRYAASSDPDYPMLCAVLLEPHPDGVRLVATDRYRLAVAEVEGAPGGHDEGSMSLLPTALADQVRRALWETPRTTGEERTVHVTLRISPARFSATLPGGAVVDGDCLDLDFPDYRRLLHDPGSTRVTSTQVPVADILAGLSGRAERHVHLDRTGVTDATGLLLDRAFLWEAASTLGEGYAVLPAEGEIAPLALRDLDGQLVSLLMPVQPDVAP